MRMFTIQEGVKPTWEHPANKKGGKWLAYLLHNVTANPARVNEMWLQILLTMIGETFDGFDSEICGLLHVGTDICILGFIVGD